MDSTRGRPAARDGDADLTGEAGEVVEVVRSVLPGRAAGVIDHDTSLRELGFDSVDLIELTVSLEKHFGLVLVDSDSYAVTTVGDVVDLVRRSRAGTVGEP